MSQLHGFESLRVQRIDELGATLHEYTHPRSGARLCWLEREDENKTFCASFRTLPYDDTGVFHILEHSVLCGSKQFPVKEPFVELLKGSLNTFLNAFTYPDKTCYPVSSRNDQDFLNLTRVYLDAVFFPSIYQKPEIFQQEGWHYELHDGALTRSGVVLNEMKGAFADPDDLLYNAMMRALFPDTPYRYVSGGDPEAIPTLRYEDFVAAHRRFYHPSNAYLLLDGSIDLDASLALLDEYLSQFSAVDPDTDIPLQLPVHPAAETIAYPLPAGQEPDTRWKFARGWVMDDGQDMMQLFAAQILCDVLCGSNHAPLCRAILQDELAEDVILSYSGDTLQPTLVLQVQNFRRDDLPRIEQMLHQTLLAQCEGALDHAQLEASLASFEFKLRERDYGTMPRGLVYELDILSSWLYGGDPAARLRYERVFEQLHAAVETGYYEALLRKLLLDGTHTADILMQPSLTCGEARQARERDALCATLETLDEAAREQIVCQQQALAAAQQTPDSAEALATIPHVTLHDLPDAPASVPTQLLPDGTIVHPLQTDGIVYVKAYFAADDLTEQELPYTTLLRSLISQLPTTQYDAQELQKQQRLLLGSLSVGLTPYTQYHAPQTYRLYAALFYSALHTKLPQAAQLAAHILTQTDFTDQARLLEVIRQLREDLQQQIINSGSSFALVRASAMLDAANACTEQLAGISFYRWLCALEEDFDARAPQLIQTLQALTAKLFCMARLRLSVTSGTPTAIETAQRALHETLPVGAPCEAPCPAQPLPMKKEGIVIPSEVSFTAVCGNVGAYTGALRLASRAASLEYYWNEIRVQGGAYGTGLSIRDNGLVCAYTYRDPDCARSRRTIDTTGEFITQLAASGTPQDVNIIGAISDAEPLLSQRLRAAVADTWLLKGLTDADRTAQHRALLATKTEALAPCAPQLSDALRTGAVCVLGPRTQLAACGDLELAEL